MLWHVAGLRCESGPRVVRLSRGVPRGCEGPPSNLCSQHCCSSFERELESVRARRSRGSVAAVDMHVCRATDSLCHVGRWPVCCVPPRTRMCAAQTCGGRVLNAAGDREMMQTITRQSLV